MPTDYSLLPTAGNPISFSQLAVQWGGSLANITLGDYYSLDFSIDSGGGIYSGVPWILPNTAIPSAGALSLSDFLGRGTRFSDQTSMGDTVWGVDDIEFVAGFDGVYLTGYTDYGSGTGTSDFGTPVDTTLDGLDISSDATNTSAGVIISTDGPDQPYFYFFVAPASHALAGSGSGQIEGTPFTEDWYAFQLKRTAGGTNTTEYYLAEDATAMAGSDNLYGWYWDVNDGVTTSDIVDGDSYRLRKIEAGGLL